MANYAVINDENIVINVFAGNDENTDGVDWEAWYSELLGKRCLRTSIHTFANYHSDGKEPFRKNYAGIGYTYDEQRDAFIPEKPFESWILNEETCQWNPPIQKPEGRFKWDEELVSWVEDINNG